MLAPQPIEGEGLLDVVLDPVGELGKLALPALEPGRQIAARLREVAAVIVPAQLLQALVVPLPGHVIQGIPEKMHVAALPGGGGQDFGNRLLQPRMIVRDHDLDAGAAAFLQAQEEVLPARPALPVGQLHRQHLTPVRLACAAPPARRSRLTQSMPSAIETAWLRITAASRTFS